jgi:hypothetical protein
MKTFHARNEESLRNGSAYIKTTGPSGRTLGISHYMNGDFMGWVQLIPDGLQVYTNKDGRKMFCKFKPGVTETETP